MNTVTRTQHLSHYVDLLVELCARTYSPAMADRTERAIAELEASAADAARAEPDRPTRGSCRTCGHDYALTGTGVVRSHIGNNGKACRGSGRPPAVNVDDLRNTEAFRFGYTEGYQQGRHDAQMDAANPSDS